MRATSFAALLLVSFCACSSETDTSDDPGTSNGGRPNVDNDNNNDDDNSGRTDTQDESDASTSTDAGGSRDTGGTRDIGGGSDTNPGGGGACAADTLDEAIDCQVAANDGFVDAYCDCFTEQGYDGDRAACEADQPDASAFEPDACARAALLRDEDAAIANSACYAAAVDDLAGCFAVCPPNEETFNACFDDLNAAFDVCDASLPATVTDALAACGGGPVEPPADVSAATAALESQRDAWVASYCVCYGASEFGSVGTCTTTQSGVYNPGLSACEQTAVSTQGEAGLAFLVCLGESFTIAESGCTECPASGSIEYDLCADPGVDINFCFGQATTALQDALIACSR
jgi:hypothetical protein